MSLEVVRIHPEIRQNIPKDALRVIRDCLYAQDCQTCNKSLATGVPNMVIQDLGDYLEVSLHHQECRPTVWLDPIVRIVDKTTTWNSRTAIASNEAGEVFPYMIVNPGLEKLVLRKIRDGVKIEPHIPSMDGLRPAGGPKFRIIEDATPQFKLFIAESAHPKTESTSMSAFGWSFDQNMKDAIVTTPHTTWSTDADTEWCRWVKEFGGAMLFVTIACDPAAMYDGVREAMNKAMRSPYTWIASVRLAGDDEPKPSPNYWLPSDDEDVSEAIFLPPPRKNN